MAIEGDVLCYYKSEVRGRKRNLQASPPRIALSALFFLLTVSNPSLRTVYV